MPKSTVGRLVLVTMLFSGWPLGWSVGAYAQSVSPTEYTVPVSSANQLRFGANGNYSGRKSETVALDASGSLLYNRFYNSLPFAYDVSINAAGNTQRQADGSQKNSYNTLVTSGVRKYFKPEGNWFYSLDSRVTSFTAVDRPAIEATPGLGYGRFIKATALARAVRIEDFLIKENVVTGNLPKAAMIELAHVIENEGEYRTKHGDRYRVYWFEAMEEVIRQSGHFAGEGLGAVGVLRIEEVLFQERVNERFYGWDVRAGVRVELLTHDKNLDRSDPGASLRLRFSRPLGWKSQFGFDLQYTSPFNSDFGAEAYTFTGTVNYIYELGNRIDFTLDNIVTATRSTPMVDVAITESLRAGFLFFIENQIALGINSSLAKEHEQDLIQSVNFSLEYRLR